MSKSPQEKFAVLSIGALSRATGVPVETLRTWERRYDFPKPAPRGDSGHRRYPIASVEQLKLVVLALEARHAPAVALRASPKLLRELVSVAAPGLRPPGASALPRLASRADGSFEVRCIEHVLALDGDALTRQLEQAWDELGGLECLVLRVGPFLTALGAGWSEGLIEVGHEHFASEHVREFLIGHWRPMSERNLGPPIVCATLAGELHVLGLHLAATALALTGARVIFLGANTPTADVARTAKQQGAAAIALSAAAGTAPRLLHRELTELRSIVPAQLPIVVGGGGFTKVPRGVLMKTGLRELSEWARHLSAEPAKRLGRSPASKARKAR